MSEPTPTDDPKAAVIADAIIAAAVKLAAAKLADAQVMAEARVAAELKIAEAKSADKKDSRETMKTVYLPIALAALVAFPGIVAAWRINTTEAKVDEVHKTVNSRMTELLEISKKNSRAEGVIEGEANRKK
jgi:ABC-type transporter MlaC component